MTTISEDDLCALLVPDTSVVLVEPHIYSVFPDRERGNVYDTQFGTIYDLVACNPLYNRILWGYSTSIFESIASDVLKSSRKGKVLDLGCGSLAFTARTYSQYSQRPVVLVDQSLKMLRMAKSRLVEMSGAVPANMVLLQADASQLPFVPDSFSAILSENLLHCLHDTMKVLQGLKEILVEDGKMVFTTLVKGNRLADCYLQVLAKSGKLLSRGMEEHQAVFDQLELPMRYELRGNMAVIYYQG